MGRYSSGLGGCMMELKIEFVAYFWDNPQGDSGRFLDLDMNVEVSSVQEDKDIWEFIFLYT